MSEAPRGYEVEIYQGLWDRPKSFGAPRGWAAVWLITALFAALLAMVGQNFSWLKYVGVTWVGGQAILVALTTWDAQWDQVWRAWLFQRGARYYRAG